MSIHWNVLHRTVIATSPLALAYFELESAVFTGLCDDAEASDTGLVCAVLITFSLGPYLKLQIIGHSTQYLFAVVAEWHQVQWYVLRSDSIYFAQFQILVIGWQVSSLTEGQSRSEHRKRATFGDPPLFGLAISMHCYWPAVLSSASSLADETVSSVCYKRIAGAAQG